METYESFDEAKARADLDNQTPQTEDSPTDWVVSGVIMPDGNPRYFLTRSQAPDAEVRAMAFAVREGREMNQNERVLVGIVDKTVGSSRGNA